MASDRPNARAGDPVLFAWQGLQIHTPPDWDLAGVSGDAEEGYCRLDGDGMSRLEIKWRRGLKTGGVSTLVDQFLKDARLDRKGSPVRVRRGVPLVTLPGMDCECFLTQGGQDVIHLATLCRECGRASVLRFPQPPGETSQSVARRVLGSFRDHPAGEATPWSMYGFRFSTPAAFRLRSHLLQAGRTQLDFAGRKCTALALRLGLAQMALRGVSLLDWARRDTLGLWTDTRVEFASAEHKGHPSVVVQGRERRLWRRRDVRGILWHCDAANALYLAAWRGKARALEPFMSFADSIECL